METIQAKEPFKQALEEGTPERVLAALQQGADVAAEINFGHGSLTPLAYCIQSGREDLVALLMDHGASLGAHEAGAYCKALRLLANTQSSLSMLRLLLERGLDSGIKLRLKMVDASICLCPMLLRVAQYGSVHHLDLLCRAGADLSLTDERGVNVLMAAFRGDGRHTDIKKIEFIEKQGFHQWHATTSDKAYNLYAFVQDAAGIRLLLDREVDCNHVDADGLTPLVWAAINQNTAGAELLMRAGAVVAPQEASLKERERLFRIFLGLHPIGENKMHSASGPTYAERQLNEVLLSYLFARTLHAEERRRICNLALFAACAQKSRELASYCLSEGADIHTHIDGLSLLGVVCARPYRRSWQYQTEGQSEQDLIAYLLEQGAELNCRAFGVRPVLLTALDYDASPEMIEFLLAHGADKSQAIISAIRRGKTELLGLLLASGPVDKDLLYKAFLGEQERSARFFIGRRRLSRMWRELREQGVIELAENDTDALGIPLSAVLGERRISDPSLETETSADTGKSRTERREEDETIILSAEEYEAVEQHISAGDEAFIRDMLKKYPRFATANLKRAGNAGGYGSRKALSVAAASAQTKICRILVDSCVSEGRFLNEIWLGLYRLRFAEDGAAKTETLRILLEYARSGQKSVDKALLTKCGHPWSDEQVALFLEYGAEAVAAAHGGATLLHRALRLGAYPLAEQLVRLGCSLEACSDNGYTCLHWACCGGNPDCVRLCIEAGADVHRAIETSQGEKVTPVSLYWEVRQKEKSPKPSPPETEILELLIQHGVSADWMDASGMTLLMHAIRTAHSAEMVKMLLQHGADVHLRDREGNTPLMLAVLEQEEEICRLLIEAGASLEERNNAGCTAMDFARLMQDEEKAEA